MIPVYTYVYPFKTLDEGEAPQTQGQCSAIAPPGYTRQNGGFHGGLSGLGMFWSVPLLGGFAVYEGCKAGYLPESICGAVDIETPGKTMNGACPEAYKVEGVCTCPKGNELPDGGCTYEPGFSVDANGALPIGGNADAAATTIDPMWLALGAVVGIGAGIYLFKKK